MRFNYLFCGKIFLQISLFAIFLNYFGLVSWERYKEQRVVLTSAGKHMENLPPPAITLCPIDHQDQIGYIDAIGEDDGPAVHWKGNLISHLCHGKEGDEIVGCIEEKAVDQTTIAKFVTKGFQKENSLPEQSFWRTEFSHGIAGLCSTIQIPYPLGIDLAKEAIWIGLNSSYAFIVYIHDPNFFLINNNPSLPMNVFLQDAGMIAYKMYVAQRHNINVPNKKECNSDPTYSFAACIKETFSQKVGCKQKWDSWTSLDLPPCEHMDQYRYSCFCVSIPSIQIQEIRGSVQQHC